MFFEFRQNNSGGRFEQDLNRGISQYVIVEADSAEDAVDRAERIGLYFNGCDSGMDCPCCGDRWYVPYDHAQGKEKPYHYDQPIEEYRDKWGMIWKEADHLFIHYKDGTITKYKHVACDQGSKFKFLESTKKLKSIKKDVVAAPKKKATKNLTKKATPKVVTKKDAKKSPVKKTAKKKK